jgi:hypothetical protein
MGFTPKAEDWNSERWQKDVERALLNGARMYCKLVLGAYRKPAEASGTMEPIWRMLAELGARELGGRIRQVRAGSGNGWSLRRLHSADYAIEYIQQVSHLIHQSHFPTDQWHEVYYSDITKHPFSPYFHGSSRSLSDDDFFVNMTGFMFDKRPSYQSHLHWSYIGGVCRGNRGPAFSGDVSIILAQKTRNILS